MASVSGVKMQYSRLFLVYTQNRRRCSGTYCRHSKGSMEARPNVLDEVAMSKHLMVGDMLSAEVQQIRMRGQLQLHTRNMKYGKFGRGIMVKVPSNLVKPQKEYMREIYGVSVTIGCNGITWISPALIINPDDKRKVLVRIAACMRMLAKNLIAICDVMLMSAYSVTLTDKQRMRVRPDQYLVEAQRWLMECFVSFYIDKCATN
ncbi:hypothetical protein V3C99_018726 [Haemonchus contortus]